MSFDLLLTEDAVCTDKHPSDPTAKVVACSSPEAGFQVVGQGMPISEADAKRFGVKTKKADTTNYTLRIDSHTIARTPEEKAYAATQPQPGLALAQAEAIRQSAALSIASLATTAATANADAAAESKKADAAADKKLKANLEDKSAKAMKSATKKAPRAASAKTSSKAKTKTAATTAAGETTPANP